MCEPWEEGGYAAKKVDDPHRNNFLKILKYFASPKLQAALTKLFSPLPDKSFVLLWNKNFLTEIYRQEYIDICFPSAFRMQFLGV